MKQKLKKYIAYTRDETTRCRRADFAPIALHAASSFFNVFLKFLFERFLPRDAMHPRY